MTARSLIKKLKLEPLPGEGGYFRRTYQSSLKTTVASKGGESVAKNLGTAILYLVTPKEFSALHRISSDEIFHFYLGDPVEMLQISEKGQARKTILGSGISRGQEVQAAVPAGTWQGTRLAPGGKYALLGTTVVPGFDFADFELGKRQELVARFPRLEKEITRYTRN